MDIQRIVVNLWQLGVVDCHLCDKPSLNKGIPVYEDYVLPNDWDGEWGGVPACDCCFDKQQKLVKPALFEEFNE